MVFLGREFQKNATSTENTAAVHLERYYFPTGPEANKWKTQEATNKE